MKLSRIVVLLGVLLFASRAEALPFLQLDIIGGHYDEATDTIVSGGPTFTLVALLSPGPQDNLASLLADTYYVSAAITPAAGPSGSNLGSFSFNGTTYNATSDMTYGTPPADLFGAGSDSGDLSPHGVFPTFFREFSFNFSSARRALEYDAEETPGGLTTTSATSNVLYYTLFNVTVGLTGDRQLHFDLYNTSYRNLFDEDIDERAPFSHDAESGPASQVPEPQSLGMMAMGLLFAGRMLRRRVTN
jgi:hypothetical protein